MLRTEDRSLWSSRYITGMTSRKQSNATVRWVACRKLHTWMLWLYYWYCFPSLTELQPQHTTIIGIRIPHSIEQVLGSRNVAVASLCKTVEHLVNSAYLVKHYLMQRRPSLYWNFNDRVIVSFVEWLFSSRLLFSGEVTVHVI